MIIGYTDIDGDLLHLNHLKFFKECRQYCDYLIIGVCSDAYTTSYKRAPILDENTRLETVKECHYVDHCFLVDSRQMPITQEFMKTYQIDIVFHAHTLEDHIYYKKFYEIPITQNKFKRLEYGDGVSTSKIISIIKKRFKEI